MAPRRRKAKRPRRDVASTSTSTKHDKNDKNDDDYEAKQIDPWHQPSPLLRLPAELRNLVYDFVYTEHCLVNPSCSLGFRSTCRQIRDELGHRPFEETIHKPKSIELPRLSDGGGKWLLPPQSVRGSVQSIFTDPGNTMWLKGGFKQAELNFVICAIWHGMEKLPNLRRVYHLTQFEHDLAAMHSRHLLATGVYNRPDYYDWRTIEYDGDSTLAVMYRGRRIEWIVVRLDRSVHSRVQCIGLHEREEKQIEWKARLRARH